MPDRSRPGSTTTALHTVRLQGGGDRCATGAKIAIRLLKEGTTIGAWNACSLLSCGKVQEPTHKLKRYRLNILGLAEVGWTGFGEITVDEEHTIWYCGADSL